MCRTFIKIAMLLFLGASCTSALPDPRDNQLFTLSRQLAQVAEQLSGTFSVYDANGTFIASRPLEFSENASGQSIVTAKSITLTKETSYRFVVLFFWNDVPIAYVDTVQKTSNAPNSTIFFSENLIIYDRPAGLLSSLSEDLSADIAAGFLPDLDLDADGYSNFIELRSGTDYNDPQSVPQGPQISNFTVGIHDQDLEMLAIVEDGNGVDAIVASFPEADYLRLVLVQSTEGALGDKQVIYQARLPHAHAPTGELKVQLTSTNGLGLESAESRAVLIPEDANNVAPVIDFESLQESQIVGGTVTVAIRAYDRDGLSSLRVVSPDFLRDRLIDRASAADRFVADWDTTENQNGQVPIVVEAIDIQGLRSERLIHVQIENGSDVSGPSLDMKVSQAGEGGEVIDFEGGDTVYGRIRLEVTAVDPSAADTLVLLNADSYGDALSIEPRSGATTYLATLNTEAFVDDSELAFRFLARDRLGNQTERTFSMRVGNHPVIESLRVQLGETAFDVEDDEIPELTGMAGDDLHVQWQARNVDEMRLVHEGQDVGAPLAAPSLTAELQSSGTYEFQAIRRSNTGDKVVLRTIIIHLDEDGDGVDNEEDNCRDISNEGQRDLDEDGLGDLCDDDKDGDGFAVDHPNECNDTHAGTNVEQTEGFDGLDNDCDGSIDEDLWQQISVGSGYVCGLKNDGTVKCWGENYFDKAEAPDFHFMSVSAGRDHACGFLENGDVTCWGKYFSGATEVPELEPGASYELISLGLDFTCAVRGDRSLTCWGSNTNGKSSPPREGSYTSVNAGSYHACAIRADGPLVCWGKDEDGQANPPEGEFVQVSAGKDYTCALRENGTLACWGSNEFGLLNVPEGIEFISIGTGIDFACGLTREHRVRCWGEGAAHFDLPEGELDSLSVGSYGACALRPDDSITCWGSRSVLTPLGGQFVQIDAGVDHVCGVRVGGRVGCWGRNGNGQSQPPDGSFQQVSAGYFHSCAINYQGHVNCWGRYQDQDNNERHGCDHEPDLFTPQNISFLKVSAGECLSCGIIRDTRLMNCWGPNSAEIMIPDSRLQSISLGGLSFGGAITEDDELRIWIFDDLSDPVSGFNKISIGYLHYCAIRKGDMSLFCEGGEGFGENNPPQEQFIAISSGRLHSCGILKSGHATCWGVGQIEDGTQQDKKYIQISAGHAYACAVRTSGLIDCWGTLYYRPD
jgi:alpha-tubulin suppressor-like RCC1 family protein